MTGSKNLSLSMKQNKRNENNNWQKAMTRPLLKNRKCLKLPLKSKSANLILNVAKSLRHKVLLGPKRLARLTLIP